MLRRIETRFLQDETLSGDELSARVEDVARVPPPARTTTWMPFLRASTISSR